MAPVSAKAQSAPTSMGAKPAKPAGGSAAERRRPRLVRAPKEQAQSQSNSGCFSVPLNAEVLLKQSVHQGGQSIENTQVDFEDQFHECVHDLMSGIWSSAYHDCLDDDPDTVQIYTDEDDDAFEHTKGGVPSVFGMREIETTESAKLAAWMKGTSEHFLEWSMRDAAWNEEEEDVTNEDEDVANENVVVGSCVSASIVLATVSPAQCVSSTCVSQFIPKQQVYSVDTHLTQESVSGKMRSSERRSKRTVMDCPVRIPSKDTPKDIDREKRHGTEPTKEVMPAGSPLNALRAMRMMAPGRSASSPLITSVNASPPSSPHVSGSQASTKTSRSAAPRSAMEMDLDAYGAAGPSPNTPHRVVERPPNKKSQDAVYQVRRPLAMVSGVGCSQTGMDLKGSDSHWSWTSMDAPSSKVVYTLKSGPKKLSGSASLGALKVVKSNGNVLPALGQKQQLARPMRSNIGSARKDWLLGNASACDGALVGARANTYQW